MSRSWEKCRTNEQTEGWADRQAKVILQNPSLGGGALIKVTSSFPEFISAHQKPVSLISSWDTAKFRVLLPEWSHPFMTMPTPIFSNHLLTSMNLYQHAKNQFFSSFFSRDIVDLKILQSDWPRAFWLISQKPEFFQIWK